MSNAMLNIYVRVIKKRMSEGENLETILADYTRLTEDEIILLREKINS